MAMRMDDLLSRLTLEEKVSLVHAKSARSRSPAFPAWAFPNCGWTTARWACARRWATHGSLNHMDDFATAMPATLGLAATWNPDLATAYGKVIGQEAKQRGKNIMLGPSREHPAHTVVRAEF